MFAQKLQEDVYTSCCRYMESYISEKGDSSYCFNVQLSFD